MKKNKIKLKEFLPPIIAFSWVSLLFLIPLCCMSDTNLSETALEMREKLRLLFGCGTLIPALIGLFIWGGSKDEQENKEKVK